MASAGAMSTVVNGKAKERRKEEKKTEEVTGCEFNNDDI